MRSSALEEEQAGEAGLRDLEPLLFCLSFGLLTGKRGVLSATPTSINGHRGPLKYTSLSHLRAKQSNTEFEVYFGTLQKFQKFSLKLFNSLES